MNSFSFSADKKKRDLYALPPNQYQFLPCVAWRPLALSVMMTSNSSDNWEADFAQLRANRA